MTQMQRILSALLAVQVILAVVVFWPRTPDTVEIGPLLADFEAADVISLTLEDGQGTRTTLVHEGDGWVLGDAGGYPADSEKIEPILEKLGAIQTNRLVARTNDSHKRLQVAGDEYAGRIELELDDGNTYALLVGSAPNPSGTHVRRVDRNETYLTGELAAWEINPLISNWIDTSYISLDRTDLTSLILENDNGVFEFQKGSDGEWTFTDLAEDEAFEISQFNILLSRITTMRMAAPLGSTEASEYKLDEPEATVTVFIDDSEEQSTRMLTLSVGAQDPDDGNFYVKWSSSDYYAKVSAFNVEEIVSQARADFIQVPPTPIPAP